MSSKTQGKIGTREFACIILFAIGSKFLDTNPTMLFRIGKNATWLMLIISSCVTLIPYFLILYLMYKYESIGLMELIDKIGGRIFGKAISFLIFVMSLFALISNSRGAIEIIDTMFYQRTPTIVLYISIMAGSAYIANKGLENIGRVCMIEIPMMFVVGALILALVYPDIRIIYICPILGPGIKTLLKSGVMYSAIFAEIIVFTAAMPFSRSKRNYFKGTLWGYMLCVIWMVVFFAVYVMVFDYKPIQIIPYPYQELTRIIRIGRFISNAEGIFFQFWVITQVTRFSIYLYSCALIFGYTFNVKEFEPMVLPIAAFSVIAGMMPMNLFQTLFKIRQSVVIVESGIFLSLPIALFLLSFIRGGKIK